MRKPLRKLFLVFFILQLTAFSAVGAFLSAVEGVHKPLAHDQTISHHQHGLAEIDTSGHEELAPHQHGCDGLHSIDIMVGSTPTLLTLGSRRLDSNTPKMPPDRFWGTLPTPSNSPVVRSSGVSSAHPVTTS
jgi:hypothetical protein